MARKRKTAAERRKEDYERGQAAWNAFYPRLQAVSSYVDAVVLSQSEPTSSPQRHYCSNLGFFLMSGRAPNGAGGSELVEYRRLGRAFVAEGAWKAEALEEVEQSLNEALARGLLR